MYPSGNVSIPCSHGSLEAIYRPRTESATRVALVLHPHPLFGGTMHNKVVYRTARALEDAGFETLRINFRGVGSSTGVHDEGRGEIDDAREALDYLLMAQPHASEILVAGFSFGSVVGLKLGCSDSRVAQMLSIGTSVRVHPLDFLATCAKPIVFIHGDADDIAPLAPLKETLDALPASSERRLIVVPAAGHFFDHHLPDLMKAIREQYTIET